VLLSLGSPAATAAGFADRLDVVTATLAGSHPDFGNVRAMLIRPDGYLAWATTDGADAPPLEAWLGRPSADRADR
jgi:bifunctional hydroxylase/dehydrase